MKLAYTHRATPQVMVESVHNYMLAQMMSSVRSGVNQQNCLPSMQRKAFVDPKLDLDVRKARSNQYLMFRVHSHPLYLSTVLKRVRKFFSLQFKTHVKLVEAFASSKKCHQRPRLTSLS